MIFVRTQHFMYGIGRTEATKPAALDRRAVKANHRIATAGETHP
jgi:hypothetical protein